MSRRIAYSCQAVTKHISHATAVHRSAPHVIGLARRPYSQDHRLSRLGRVIQDDYASLRETYQAPKHPVILTHGLLGFNQLRLAGDWLPGIQYWRGIEEAMKMAGAKVYVAAVPPAGSLEERATALERAIGEQVSGQKVNIIAHSMGGLDSRYLISQLRPSRFEVSSLTTIATPHQGSSLADYIFEHVGTANVARVMKLLERSAIPAGAFEQLTRAYISSKFNPAVVDDPRVRYYSFGACFEPAWTSVFKQSHDIIAELEGENDGVVSVASSVWGTYRGTLLEVSHLDLINWTNRIRWWVRESLLGKKRTFNAVALYLDIADMLAKEGF